MSTPQSHLRAEIEATRAIPFIYQTPSVASLAAGANSQVAIPFDQDSNFIWQKIAYFVDLAGAVQTDSSRVIPLVTISITDSGSSQGFQNAPIPIGALLGDGRLPQILPAPLIVKPNSTFQFGFTNFSAATTYNNLRVQLIGIKRFLTV